MRKKTFTVFVFLFPDPDESVGDDLDASARVQATANHLGELRRADLLGARTRLHLLDVLQLPIGPHLHFLRVQNEGTSG